MTWDFFQSWCIRRFETAGCLCDHTPEDGCFDAQWPPNFNDATTMIFSRSHLPRLSFVKGRIPKKLLRGPWSQEKIEFLRFLLWITSMSVDWNDPETAKIAVEGRRQAILKRKLEAVELFNHNRRLGKPPSLDTLCFAVTEAGCDRSIVFDTLLTTNIWSNKKRARYSETLHQWCDTQMEADNPKGLWLFQKLEESRIFRNRKEEIGGREACLYLEFGNYDGGPQDQLIVNDLEWNKVKPQRGWLIARSTGYSHQTINHNISWSEVTRQPGYCMYRGPNSPRRLQCWVEHHGASRTIDVWLSPPASSMCPTPIFRRRTAVKSDL
ncbi:hypothetical protein ACJQWK_07932 [Exserohilum turcicum]